MNKKSESENILNMNLLMLLIVVAFTVGMLLFIGGVDDGAALWSDFYAKELAKTINLAKPGDKITIDVQKATEIAQKRDITIFSEIFAFNNQDNEICVMLAKSRQTCYSYFNDVDIIQPQVVYGISESAPNTLQFTVSEKLKPSA